MQSYIRKILQPENLPNWVSLIAIVAVLWTLNSELSRQSLEETKLVILKQLSNTATPMKLEQVITDGYLAAISELVADGLVLQTSQGYEIRRYDPRIKDDISIAISLVLGVDNYRDTGKGLIPLDCTLFKNRHEDVIKITKLLERLRGNSVDENFEEYISSHKDVLFKQLYLMTYHRNTDLQAMLNCFDF